MVLKIQGSNQPNLNPYQKQLQKYAQTRTDTQVKVDQLQISDQAKTLQKSDGVHSARKNRIDTLKAEVESGNYKVDSEKVAQKIATFWQK